MRRQTSTQRMKRKQNNNHNNNNNKNKRIGIMWSPYRMQNPSNPEDTPENTLQNRKYGNNTKLGDFHIFFGFSLYFRLWSVFWGVFWGVFAGFEGLCILYGDRMILTREASGDGTSSKRLTFEKNPHCPWTIQSKTRPAKSRITDKETSEIPRRGRSRGPGCANLSQICAPNLHTIASISFRTWEEGCAKLWQICRKLENKTWTNLWKYPFSNAPFLNFLRNTCGPNAFRTQSRASKYVLHMTRAFCTTTMVV